MAVQKNRKSRAKRGERRSHDAISWEKTSVDSATGEAHIRHHITADGFYRGKKVIEYYEEDGE